MSDQEARDEREVLVTTAYNRVTGQDDEGWNPDIILTALFDLYDAAGKHPEPVWEYAHSANGYWNDDETEFTAEDYYDVGDDARGAIARRTKAGPWEPVEEEQG